MGRRTDATVQQAHRRPFAVSDSAKRVKITACLLLPWLWGCHVPQKPGQGTAFHRSEATTQRPYWLYLPKGYVQNKGLRADRRRYPVVVSFHGMRPFDDYRAHIRQWQSEADRYGFIVCAPRLDTCDVMARFPIDDRESAALCRDEHAVLRILDEVLRLTNADPDHVLATSFSSGGYLAHYMLNRHPERFSCLAVFQSNFTAKTLDAAQVAKYRHYPVAILTGDKDFPLVRTESIRAIEWYRNHGFTRLIAKRLLNVGHERTPELAAPIFAATARVSPSELASVDAPDSQTVNATAHPEAGTGQQEGSTHASPRLAEATTPTALMIGVRPGAAVPVEPACGFALPVGVVVFESLRTHRVSLAAYARGVGADGLRIRTRAAFNTYAAWSMRASAGTLNRVNAESKLESPSVRLMRRMADYIRVRVQFVRICLSVSSGCRLAVIPLGNRLAGRPSRRTQNAVDVPGTSIASALAARRDPADVR